MHATVKFKLDPQNPNTVEIFMGEELIGAVRAATEGPGIEVTSVHFTGGEIGREFSGTVTQAPLSSVPHVTAVRISFTKSPWTFGSSGHILNTQQPKA